MTEIVASQKSMVAVVAIGLAFGSIVGSAAMLLRPSSAREPVEVISCIDMEAQRAERDMLSPETLYRYRPKWLDVVYRASEEEKEHSK